jgi:hypothetical protein
MPSNDKTNFLSKDNVVIMQRFALAVEVLFELFFGFYMKQKDETKKSEYRKRDPNIRKFYF